MFQFGVLFSAYFVFLGRIILRNKWIIQCVLMFEPFGITSQTRLSEKVLSSTTTTMTTAAAAAATTTTTTTVEPLCGIGATGAWHWVRRISEWANECLSVWYACQHTHTARIYRGDGFRLSAPSLTERMVFALARSTIAPFAKEMFQSSCFLARHHSRTQKESERTLYGCCAWMWPYIWLQYPLSKWNYYVIHAHAIISTCVCACVCLLHALYVTHGYIRPF